MSTTDDQIANLLQQNAAIFAAYEEWSNGQVMLLAGTVDDPNSFDKDGGKTGALGYYPVVNVSGQTLYIPCIARLKSIAAGGENAETLDEILGTANTKLAAVDTAIDATIAARDDAASKAAYAGQQGDYAKQQALAIGDVGAAVTAATAAKQVATDAAALAQTRIAALVSGYSSISLPNVQPVGGFSYTNGFGEFVASFDGGVDVPVGTSLDRIVQLVSVAASATQVQLRIWSRPVSPITLGSRRSTLPMRRSLWVWPLAA